MGPMSSMGWVFPPAESADENGVVGIGADLEPETLLRAYSAGLFPMPIEPDSTLAWWSPDPRAIIPVEPMHIPRSLRRSMRRFTFSIDTAFEQVVDGCADPVRPHGWIDNRMKAAYSRMHHLGFAHSIEIRDEDGQLAGGMYGLGIGGFFAGESMFHRRTDASKAAVAVLLALLPQVGVELFDVQWLTPHLISLGAVEVPRSEYLALLGSAVAADVPGTTELAEIAMKLGTNRPIELL